MKITHCFVAVSFLVVIFGGCTSRSPVPPPIPDDKQDKRQTPPAKIVVSFPPEDQCCIFIQNYSGAACNLYSRLAAGLQLPQFRARLEKMLVRQDDEYAVFRFPVPKGLSQYRLDFLEGAAEKEYRVKKNVQITSMAPSADLWVNLFSAAFAQFLVDAKVGSPNSYDLDIISGKDHFDALFGGRTIAVERDLGIKPECSYVGTPAKSKCKSTIVLQPNGQIEELKGGLKTEHGNGDRNILIISTPDHATSVYYKNRRWHYFDNLDASKCNQCGMSDPVQQKLQSARDIRIVSVESDLDSAQKDALKPDENARFEVEDFGGGGHCFFYSVAGILRPLDGKPDNPDHFKNQQWVRAQMANRVRHGSPAQKERWMELIHIYKTDPKMKSYYEGVESSEDLAALIENSGHFSGRVYQGDEFSIGIAEETFDITLAPIDNIKPNAADNYFKQGPSERRFRKRLAFLRQTGGDAGGHFQVHKYVEPGAKNIYYGFNLADPRSIPIEVQKLIKRYAAQYNIVSDYHKICRPKATACSRFARDEFGCKSFEINKAKLCIWDNERAPRCEATAGCATAIGEHECFAFETKDGAPVCEFIDAMMSCEELRIKDSEVGCRGLSNPTQASCSQVEILRNGRRVQNFCSFQSGAPSNCTTKVSINPCEGRCGTDAACEER